MTAIEIRVLRLPDADPDVPLPTYHTEGSAGMDICANFAPADRESGMVIQQGERALVPTGLALEIPEGYEIQLRPRSGLAFRDGLTLLNSPGTIDSDYRGPVGLIMINHGALPVRITHGMRVAQMVIAPVIRGKCREVETVGHTARGVGGFGSTGGGTWVDDREMPVEIQMRTPASRC